MRKRILVVEDTPDLLRNMAQSFSIEGYEVMKASDGEEALEWLQNIVPDVIIIDLIMPRMDGISLIECIKKNLRLREVPIIVFSVKNEAREKVLEMGVVKFISKPTSVENMVNAVLEVV